MTIEVRITGENQLEARISGATDKLRAALYKKVTALGLMLHAKIVRKLSGEVLNVRSGALRQSIFTPITTMSGDTITTTTGSSGNVKYASIWETTGSAAHDIFPTKAKALHFIWGGQERFFKRVHIPAQAPRPFIKPALAEMAGIIDQELTEAVVEGLSGS
jgi:hypothetical protein